MTPPALGDAEHLRISEIFSSLQGEGPHSGTPCVFLRLAVCNLRCAWCDTKYTWDFKTYRYDDEVKEESVVKVLQALQALKPRHLVITGGEPLLQQPALEALLAGLGPELFVEVETNGTIAPSRALSERIQHWNVSPKLANSDEPAARRLHGSTLLSFRALEGAWLKLVLQTEAEWNEVAALLASTGWPKERVLLMPQASKKADLQARSGAIAELAAQHGVRFSTRLQLLLWDGARGT